jgi:hypothetical protein
MPSRHRAGCCPLPYSHLSPCVAIMCSVDLARPLRCDSQVLCRPMFLPADSVYQLNRRVRAIWLFRRDHKQLDLCWGSYSKQCEPGTLLCVFYLLRHAVPRHQHGIDHRRPASDLVKVHRLQPGAVLVPWDAEHPMFFVRQAKRHLSVNVFRSRLCLGLLWL